MSSLKKVRRERMFPDELEQAFAECPLIYFPYGMCEPHGSQNALGLDALKVHAIACLAAQKHGGIVAPPDFWHIHGFGGYAAWAYLRIGEVKHAWLTSVPPWVHFKNICYHIRTADALGFHAAILFTGHYGPNWVDLKRLVELIQPYVGARLYALPDFEANQPGFDQDGKSGGDHAGKVETSLLWALHPECVDISRLPAPGEPSPNFAMGADAHQADRRIGERMLEDEVRWLGEKGKELLKGYEEIKPQHTLRTFNEVERIWDSIIRPELKHFQSMQLLWEEEDVYGVQSPPPDESVWRENWRIDS